MSWLKIQAEPMKDLFLYVYTYQLCMTFRFSPENPYFILNVIVICYNTGQQMILPKIQIMDLRDITHYTHLTQGAAARDTVRNLKHAANRL